MATRKKAAAGKKSSTANRKGKGKAKVEKVMHEFKHHELKSGGGRRVTNPKQAIAIALSEAREAGADIPEKRGAKKQSAAKKYSGTARKSTVKKATRKAANKSGAKKTSARKRTAAKR